MVSERTLFRTLQRAEWNRKVAAKHAGARSDALRPDYYALLRCYRKEQIVGVDESATNPRTRERKRGWALIGEAYVALYSRDRTRRWSILPAMDVSGCFAYAVIHEGFISRLFEDFL